MRLPIFALTAAAATASASTVSFNNSAFAAGNSTYFNIDLSKFDTSLGTLTGVTVTINEFSVQGSFTATAVSGSGDLNFFGTTATLRQDPSNTLGFTIRNGTESTDDNIVITPSVGTTLSEGQTQTFTITEYIFLSNVASSVDSSFWSAYQGSGDILFQLRNSPTATLTAETAQFSNTLATSFADMTVTYTYTPVPEPSTYGMILGGLALAGAALRRRQKAAK